MKIRPFLITPAVMWLGLVSCGAEDPKKTAMEVLPDPPEAPEGRLELSDEEWRERLTPEQFRILRQGGTERPGGKVYQEFKVHGEGAYHCAGCNALLFTSNEKFDSGCGWPSFYDPAKAQNVVRKMDRSLGMVRIEVVCAVCDGHLGHVFEGEGFNTPTDKRYCINGTGLKFVPAAEREHPKAAEESEKE
jgi:peptide-methionine (R)-S-oxide reductase